MQVEIYSELITILLCIMIHMNFRQKVLFNNGSMRLHIKMIFGSNFEWISVITCKTGRKYHFSNDFPFLLNFSFLFFFIYEKQRTWYVKQINFSTGNNPFHLDHGIIIAYIHCQFKQGHNFSLSEYYSKDVAKVSFLKSYEN